MSLSATRTADVVFKLFETATTAGVVVRSLQPQFNNFEHQVAMRLRSRFPELEVKDGKLRAPRDSDFDTILCIPVGDVWVGRLVNVTRRILREAVHTDTLALRRHFIRCSGSPKRSLGKVSEQTLKSYALATASLIPFILRCLPQLIPESCHFDDSDDDGNCDLSDVQFEGIVSALYELFAHHMQSPTDFGHTPIGTWLLSRWVNGGTVTPVEATFASPAAMKRLLAATKHLMLLTVTWHVYRAHPDVGPAENEQRSCCSHLDLLFSSPNCMWQHLNALMSEAAAAQADLQIPSTIEFASRHNVQMGNEELSFLRLADTNQTATFKFRETLKLCCRGLSKVDELLEAFSSALGTGELTDHPFSGGLYGFAVDHLSEPRTDDSAETDRTHVADRFGPILGD